jgi:hypothetical protein
MKRILGACLVLSMALFAFGAVAFAADAHKGMGEHHMAAAANKTVTGEIVDLGCYLGHGAKSASHKECAATCIKNGGPMGLLTDKGVLYVLTMNHDNQDAFNNAKNYAGDKVEVTGPVMVKNGMKAMEVNGVKTI